MSRPDTALDAIESQLAGWDATADNNNDKLRSLLFTGPRPLPLAHRTTANEGSLPLSGFPAADYKWCELCLVDAATPATNGWMIISDGADWRYQRTHTVVT